MRVGDGRETEGHDNNPPAVRATPAGLDRPATNPVEILNEARADRRVIQDFRPLAESIEWELAQLYWNERGGGAFLSDGVPFVINNDGNLSRNAADVFFASLAESDRNGRLGQRILALEMGAGLGLFARYFLDAFRDLCGRNNKDYYEKLCYVVSDRSERMLGDLARNGVFSGHPGRYELRLVDALRPDEELWGQAEGTPPAPFRAVFLNYILDTLPAAALKVEGSAVSELRVRTSLGRNVDLKEYTTFAFEELVRRAESPDPKNKVSLVDLQGLFALEYEYLPVDPRSVPYGDFVLQFALNEGPYVLHNHGAIRCIERSLRLLHDEGFILINDYPHKAAQCSAAGAMEAYQYQRFAGSTAIGLNFSLLRSYFAKYYWLEPPEDNEHIHSRLLGREIGPATTGRFHLRFDKANLVKVNESVEAARVCVQQAQHEAALAAYSDALKEQPGNWSVMGEVASLLTHTLKDYASGLKMAEAAIGLNPLAAELWNTYGDSLYYLNHIDEAHKAFLRALELNPGDVRARYNLVYTFVKGRDFDSALRTIAEGLARDKTGEYCARFLEKQNEILRCLEQRRLQQAYLAVNHFSRYGGA